MIIIEVTDDHATVEFSAIDLHLLANVFNHKDTQLPLIAGENEFKYAALTALGSAFTSLNFAVDAMDEEAA